MLQNTFLHIPYVGEKTEQQLWQHNIRSWHDVGMLNGQISNAEVIRKFSMLSKERFEKDDFAFFAQKLASKFHWRAYDEYKERTCFVDIETTGLSKHRDDITVIGLYDGKESKTFINGINLRAFEEEIQKYALIVTFNGALFDLPFIKAKFPSIVFDQFHVDLRFALKNLGYSGGLKNIERQVGIERESDVSGFTGLDAIRLWKKYKRQDDEKALNLLVKYCIEDIENLEYLMDMSYKTLKDKTFC